MACSWKGIYLERMQDDREIMLGPQKPTSTQMKSFWTSYVKSALLLQMLSLMWSQSGNSRAGVGLQGEILVVTGASWGPIGCSILDAKK